MRTFRLFAVSVFFAAIFAVSAFAQTTPTGDRIGLVAWGPFEDPAKGIKKYATAITSLDKEFEPGRVELNGMSTRYQALQKEIQGFQDALSKQQKLPIPETEVQKKVDQLSQMERDIKFKQEDLKAKYQSRFNIVVGPVQEDILKALSEYATAKGFALILDGARLQESGILLGFSQKVNVTEDFITFYNARTPTTAVTTTTPK
jgi:Skp family chaperone for outer membrane proteins